MHKPLNRHSRHATCMKHCTNIPQLNTAFGLMMTSKPYVILAVFGHILGHKIDFLANVQHKDTYGRSILNVSRLLKDHTILMYLIKCLRSLVVNTATFSRFSSSFLLTICSCSPIVSKVLFTMREAHSFIRGTFSCKLFSTTYCSIDKLLMFLVFVFSIPSSNLITCSSIVPLSPPSLMVSVIMPKTGIWKSKERERLLRSITSALGWRT